MANLHDRRFERGRLGCRVQKDGHSHYMMEGPSPRSELSTSDGTHRPHAPQFPLKISDSSGPSIDVVGRNEMEEFSRKAIFRTVCFASYNTPSRMSFA